MPFPTSVPAHYRMLKCHMLDVSAANSATYVAVPWKCKVVKVGVTMHGVVDTVNAVITTSVVVAGAATAITGGAITVTVPTVAGDSFEATPTADTHVNEGEAIGFVSGGESSTTSSATCWAIVDLSGDK